jgi:hypothetical protein
MSKKKRLDYIAIPDSSGKVKKERKKKAIEELKKRYVEEIVILKGGDSEEDILYLGKILKKGDRVGFDTFPLHYKEYKTIIKKAKKEGKFPKGIKIENIKTSQGPRLFLYGLLGLSEEKIKKKGPEYVKNRDEKFLSKIKGFVKKILS